MTIPVGAAPNAVSRCDQATIGEDGRVTDIWTQFDGVALMQQLGAIPA